jgi:hypothetical protein
LQQKREELVRQFVFSRICAQVNVQACCSCPRGRRRRQREKLKGVIGGARVSHEPSRDTAPQPHRAGYAAGSSGLKVRLLMHPHVFQTIRQGTPGVVPLRAATVSFCNVIPSGPVFLGSQKVSHLAAFDGMPSEFL